MTEICQRACKFAIREEIHNEIASNNEQMDMGLSHVELRHFEEAMKYARRSVTDNDIRKYELFSQTLNQSRGLNDFAFDSSQNNTTSNFEESNIDDLYT